jgi:superfamily I DNA/RNA helicase
MNSIKNPKIPITSNFAMLEPLSVELAKLGVQAEHYYHPDPVTCIVKSRTLCEQITFWMYAEEKMIKTLSTKRKDGTDGEGVKDFATRIQELYYQNIIGKTQAGMLHSVRKLGNPAVHENRGDIEDAHTALRHCHDLSLWLVREYNKADFMHYFVPPKPPKDISKERAEIIALLDAAQKKIEQDESARKAYEAEIALLAAKLAEPDISLHESLGQAVEVLPPEIAPQLGAKIKALRAEGIAGLIRPFAVKTEDYFGWIPLIDPYVLVVVQSPNQTDVIFVWIDTLSNAEAWVQVHKFEVNPLIGSLQHYTLPSEKQHVLPPKDRKNRLFHAYSDEDLKRCAVPVVLLPAVRALKDADGLDALLSHLPLEAGFALVALSQGKSLDEATTSAEVGAPQEGVNTQDLSAALEHPVSRQHFVPLNDDATLDAILRAPLAQWRVFLHPEQRKVVQAHANGPMRVMGGAGTGKTIALLHRAVYLLRHVYPDPQDRFLITTFTRNLAADLRALINDMLTPEEQARVDVMNLHQWMQSVLKKTKQVKHVASASEQQKLMREAIKGTPGAADAFAESLYLDEWILVIQAHPITTLADYLTARREGRGTALNRRQRTMIWQVMERYRDLLNARNRIDWFDLARITREQWTQTGQGGYRGVLVDEVQDFKAEELRLIRAIVPEGPNDLFFVGDNHQRIFGAPFPFASCGVHIRGRSHRLTLNYRTTERIRNHAVSVLSGQIFDDQDEGSDHLSGYRSLRVGVDPIYHLCASAEEELLWMAQQVKSWLETCEPESICIAAPTRQACSKYLRALHAAGVTVIEVTEQMPKTAGVRVATMHRLKGTEFKRVIIAGIQNGTLPATHKGQDFADTASEEDHARSQRSLFYVAATRARDLLYVSGYGDASPFLKPDILAARLQPEQIRAMAEIFQSLPQPILNLLKHLLAEVPMPLASLEAQLVDYTGKMDDAQPPLDASLREKASTLLKKSRDVLSYLAAKPRPLTEQMLGQVGIRYLVLQDDASPDFDTPNGLDDDERVLDLVLEALSLES